MRTVIGGLFMKLDRLLAFILSSAVSCCVCTPVQYSSAEGGKYLLGDVDGDGKVSSVDASAVLAEYAAISGGNEPAFSEVQFRAADITRDGKTDSVDASQILSYYAYLSTGGTLIMEDFLAQPPVTTTAATNSATTTIVTTTTNVTTTVKKSEPPASYDYTLENITKSANVFNQLASNMNNGVLHGSSILLDDCNGEKYWMYGEKEARIALLLLNADETYDSGVLSEVFEDYTDDDIRNGVMYFFHLPTIEEYTNVDLDFNNYALNKDIANYMNNLKNASQIARETGNCDDLNSVLDTFDRNEYLWNNSAVVMLTIEYASTFKANKYYGDYCLIKMDDMKNYKNSATDKVKKLIN